MSWKNPNINRDVPVYDFGLLSKIAPATWIGEASTLTGGANFELRRLYFDACDIGCRFRSPKTGKLVTFYMVREMVSGPPSAPDSEVMGWALKPVDKRVMINEVVVLND